MKKLILFILTFFSLSVLDSRAQYLELEHGRFVNEEGVVYTDREVRELIGDEVFNETYKSATNQFFTGRSLFYGGIITSAAGFTIMVGTAMALAARSLELDDLDGPAPYGYVGMMMLGWTGAVVGEILLNIGIPFWIIGGSRLHWIEDDYRDRQRGYSLRLSGSSAGPGLGLTLSF